MVLGLTIFQELMNVMDAFISDRNETISAEERNRETRLDKDTKPAECLVVYNEHQHSAMMVRVNPISTRR